MVSLHAANFSSVFRKSFSVLTPGRVAQGCDATPLLWSGALSAPAAPAAPAAPFARQSDADRTTGGASPAERFASLRRKTAAAFNVQAISLPFGSHAISGTSLSLASDRAPRRAATPPPLPRKDAPGSASTLLRQRKDADARSRAMHAMLGDETPSSERVNQAAAAKASNALSAPLQRLAALFPGANEAAFDMLQIALHAPALPGAVDRTLLGDALAAASGGDSYLAREILERLAAGLDLRDGGELVDSQDQAVECGVWRTAQLLSRTDDGFALLQALEALQPADAASGRAARILLQTADHCVGANGGSPVPAAVDASFDNDPALHGCLAAAARRAARLMLVPGTLLSAAEKGAVFAWEQGFREDGPGSALESAKHRLTKFTHKSIPRVARSRWRSFFARLGGRKKSPLSAMRHGMHGAHLGDLASEAGRRAGDLRLLRPKKEDARQLLERLIEAMQSSGHVRFADGARHGCTTRGLTCALSNAIHGIGVPFGIRLNLARHRATRSILEISRSHHGGEILIGTERRDRSMIGAGAVGVDLARARESRRPSGVMLRVIRRRRADGKGHDDARLKAGMRNVVRFLFDESGNPDASTDGVFNRLACRFFDDPDISLGWSEQKSRSVENSASATVSLAAHIPATGLRIGPSAGVTATRSTAAQPRQREVGGSMQASSHRSGAGNELVATIGIAGKIAGIPAEGADGVTSDIGVLNTNLMEWTIPFYRHGQHVKAKLIRERGTLQAEACTLDFEFTDFDDYAKAVADECIVGRPQARLAGNGAVKPACNAEAIAHYLACARQFARNNQTFVLRKRMHPDVACRINRNAAASDAIAACSHLPLATRNAMRAQLAATSQALLA